MTRASSSHHPDGGDAQRDDSRAALAELNIREQQRLAADLHQIMIDQADGMLGPTADPNGTRDGTKTYEIELDGRTLTLKVPRVRLKDGAIKTPDLYKLLRDQNREQIDAIVAHGVRTRDVAAISALSSPTGKPRRGSSRANAHRKGHALRRKHLEVLMARDLSPERIVAGQMDGIALGTPKKKRTVVIAHGLTADGRWLALGVAEDQYETGEMTARLLESLIDRGLDERIVWTIDGGPGLRDGIEAVSQEPPDVQICLAHKWRNIRDNLPDDDALRKEIHDRVFAAWNLPDATDAIKDLKAIAADLVERGHKDAAASLLKDLEGTVTAIRLGLPPSTRQLIRTTNWAESVNAEIRRETNHITNWGDKPKRRKDWDGYAVAGEVQAGATVDRSVHEVPAAEPSEPASDNDMRRRWAAHVVITGEPGWERVACTDGLAALEARLDGQPPVRPPTLAMREFTVATSIDDGEAQARAERWLAAASQVDRAREGDQTSRQSGQAPPDQSGTPRWLGSAGALAALGIDADADVTDERLALALRGRHIGNAGQVRQTRRAARGITDAHGEAVGITVEAVTDLTYEVSAPAWLSRLYIQADAGQRAKIEEALIASARVALDRITRAEAAVPSGGSRSGDATHGVAAVARVRWTTEGPEDCAPRLHVEGMVFGVDRGTGRLLSPMSAVDATAQERRQAKAAAKATLQDLLTDLELAAPGEQAAGNATASEQPERAPSNDAAAGRDARPRSPPALRETIPGVDALPSRSRAPSAPEPATAVAPSTPAPHSPAATSTRHAAAPAAPAPDLSPAADASGEKDHAEPQIAPPQRTSADAHAHASAGRAVAPRPQRQGSGPQVHEPKRRSREHDAAAAAGAGARGQLGSAVLAPEMVLPARGSAADPLEEFSQRLPEPDGARIGKDALRLAPSLTTPPSESLQARLGEVAAELGRAPALAHMIRSWVRDEGPAAAWAIALQERQERAEQAGEPWRRGDDAGRGRDRAGQGARAQTTASNGLDRRRRLLGARNAELIENWAAQARTELDSRGARYRRARVQWLAERPGAFSVLDDQVRSWMTRSGRLAAERVAIERELARREQVAMIESAASAGEVATRGVPTGSESPSGLDRMEMYRGRLDVDRAALVVNYAVALVPLLNRVDTASLLVYREWLGNPFAKLPGDGSWETQRLEKAWRDTAGERRRIEQEAEAVNAQAAQLRGRAKHERLQRLAPLRDAWKDASQRLGKIEEAGRGLWEERTHPDLWMNKHAVEAASMLAADEVLVARARELRKDAEHAASNERTSDRELASTSQREAVGVASADVAQLEM
jgi:putative transposase